MTKHSLLLIFCITAMVPVLSARVLVDRIALRVNGVNITQSALSLPQITKNGQPFTADEYINQELWVQRAVQRKITPSNEEIERSVVAFKEENNMVGLASQQADERLREMIGISFAQYRTQLKRHYAAEQLKSMEMRNRASVSEIEVQTYHQAHPVVEQAQYKMQIATISPAQKHEWATLKGKLHTLEWEQFDWFNHNDVAQHLRAVYSLKKGTHSEPISFGNQFLVIKLVDKKDQHAKTLNERYAEIERTLQQEKVKLYARDAEVNLRKDAVIVTL